MRHCRNYTKNSKNLPPFKRANPAAKNPADRGHVNNMPEGCRSIGILLEACAKASRALIDLPRDL
jgi:hypothetical protein